MRERPILFSGPMVRAILSGQKTQTRRAIKLKTGDTFDEQALAGAIQEWQPVHDNVAGKAVAKRAALIQCPYGKPGDRLWVRETWAGPLVTNEKWESVSAPSEIERPEYCVYAADGGPAPEFMDADDILRCRWTPSIHMPRWASRITLEITGVRVERLQDISEDDAAAEGVERDSDGWLDYLMPSTQCCVSARESFRTLWESINGAGSWEANPWVWVVEFSRIQENDQ